MEREDNNIAEEFEAEEFEVEEPEELEEFEEFEELEEEETETWMAILLTIGAIVVLAVAIGIIFVFAKKDSDKENESAGLPETVIEVLTEETDTDDGEAETTVAETSLTIPEEETEVAVTEEYISEEESLTEPETTVEGAILTEDAVVSGEDAFMDFSDIADTVTAKDVTNLRLSPSTLDDENIISQLKNGENAERTGINEAMGWSRLIYNGQTVYAVSNFLTTDLEYKTPVVAGDVNRVTTLDGRIIIFTDCNDYITPKEYVNLRVEPSTSEGETTVRCQISNGDKVHRTGYSPDSGWSRVEYNGEILYVVSSMVYVTEG